MYVNYKSLPIVEGGDPVEVQSKRSYRVGPRVIHDLRWRRPDLASAEDDRSHHAAVDVELANSHALSFLVKAKTRLLAERAVAGIIHSVQVCEPEAPERLPLSGGQGRAAPLSLAAADWLAHLEEGDLRWGVFQPGAPASSEELLSLEGALQFRFPILLVYSALPDAGTDSHLREQLTAAKRHDRMLELSLHLPPEARPGSSADFYGALQGKCDDLLRNYARAVREYGLPILFRPNNEMNGDWCNYSAYWTSQDPGLYVLFWKRLWEIFQEERVDNALWIWNPHDRSFPDFPYNEASLYYPGDDLVDIVGLTGYNNGTFYPNETWRSFDEIYRPLCAEYQRMFPDKPFVITEFASSSHGGNKPDWIRDALRKMKDYPRIRIAVWWNEINWEGDVKARDYRLEGDEELRAFREGLSLG